MVTLLCVAVPALLKWISEEIFPGCEEEGGDVQEGHEWQRQKQEGASSPQTLSRCGHEKRSVAMATAEHPQLRGWQLQLVQQDPCSLYIYIYIYIHDSLFHFSSYPGRGMGFVLTHIFFNARFPCICSTGMPQGSILGPLPFITLHISQVLFSLHVFILPITMPMKFTFGTRVELENWTEYSADHLKFNLDSFELLLFPSLFQHLFTTTDYTAVTTSNTRKSVVFLTFKNQLNFNVLVQLMKKTRKRSVIITESHLHKLKRLDIHWLHTYYSAYWIP